MGDGAEAGRAAFARSEWGEAYDALAALSSEDLTAADCERLAIAAYLTGRDDDSVAAWEAAYRAHLEAGDAAEAARCSFWLALCLMLRGQMAQAGGWLNRTENLIEEAAPECPAAGYLLIPGVLQALDQGDADGARTMAMQVAEIGARFDDADLRAFGTLGHGQALIALDDTSGGIAELDEVMVAVTAGEVGPITSGIVYCAVILECMALFDLARAAEWTTALSTWCESQPDLVPYRGQCLVHRSQLQQASGEWPDAITTVESACRHLTDPPHPALGLAHYQEAELHRLLGELDAAEAAYREAHRHGCEPTPGVALLELARGDIDTASAVIRRALHETVTPSAKPALLAAAVEIFRAANDVVGARAAADELTGLAEGRASEVLTAMAAHAAGSVLLAEGDPVAALAELRAAAATWKRVRMPYEGARTAVIIGLSCAALGDVRSAELELDAARDTFAELGAAPDLDRLESLRPASEAGSTERGTLVLSDREREVLAHVAAGKTNREIADELVISQHTVGRHLENIFSKLGVTSRAAATAYAYEHQLL